MTVIWVQSKGRERYNFTLGKWAGNVYNTHWYIQSIILFPVNLTDYTWPWRTLQDAALFRTQVHHWTRGKNRVRWHDKNLLTEQAAWRITASLLSWYLLSAVSGGAGAWDLSLIPPLILSARGCYHVFTCEILSAVVSTEELSSQGPIILLFHSWMLRLARYLYSTFVSQSIGLSLFFFYCSECIYINIYASASQSSYSSPTPPASHLLPKYHRKGAAPPLTVRICWLSFLRQLPTASRWRNPKPFIRSTLHPSSTLEPL